MMLVLLLLYFADTETAANSCEHEDSLTRTARGLSPACFPTLALTWSHADPYKLLHNKTTPTFKLQRHSNLTFTVSTKHNGTQFACNVTFRDDKTTNKKETFSLFSFSGVLNTSACESSSDVLTCECRTDSQLPPLKWPLLENCTDYSVIASVAVSNHTVTMSVKIDSKAAFGCVSSNGSSEEKGNLTTIKHEGKQQDHLTELWRIVSQLEVILAFLIGFLLGMIFTSIITCLARKCRRQKKKPGRLTEDLEMVNAQAVQMEVGHPAEDKGIHHQEEAGMIAEPAGPSAPEGDQRPKEVEYSHLDFSLLKTQNPAEQELTKNSTETEYAEIKKETREVGEGNDGEAIEEMTEEVETKEEAALYSNVKEIMDEV